MYFMWDMHNRTTEQQARINRGRTDNGKIPQVEDTTPPYDVDDVNISVESSRVVHASARPDNTTISTGKCSHGGNDRCICGMVGA